MRLLLDSHVLLWWLENDRRLSRAARDAIEASDADPHFSAASIWELEIKQAKGKLRLPDTLLDALHAEGFAEVLISAHHARLAATLPALHEDPFDRMLVAQARSDGFTIVTRDGSIAAYDVAVLW